MKTVEFGQLVAGPLAGTLLADDEADVIPSRTPARATRTAAPVA